MVVIVLAAAAQVALRKLSVVAGAPREQQVVPPIFAVGAAAARTAGLPMLRGIADEPVRRSLPYRPRL